MSHHCAVAIRIDPSFTWVYSYLKKSMVLHWRRIQIRKTEEPRSGSVIQRATAITDKRLTLSTLKTIEIYIFCRYVLKIKYLLTFFKCYFYFYFLDNYFVSNFDPRLFIVIFWTSIYMYSRKEHTYVNNHVSIIGRMNIIDRMNKLCELHCCLIIKKIFLQ